jgi:hypothetical protein
MSRDDDENEANERRIVACVNACAGIPTEGLENSGFSSDILLKIATLKQQCDELKKALQWYADRFSNENGKPTVAQKAIAKWEKPNAIAQGREPHSGEASELADELAGPVCDCCAEHTMEEIDFNKCGYCGMPIFFEDET